MPLGFISGGGGNSPEALFRSIPPVSKALICGMVALTLFIRLDFISPMQVALAWPLVWNNFQVWRLFTCAVYAGPPSFAALSTIFNMGMFSIGYERDAFNTGGGGGSADYAFMLVFGVVVIETIMLIVFYNPFIIITTTLVNYICYVWSRKNPSMSVRFWGLSINAVYVPWVMVAITVLVGGSVFNALLGIAVGHLFYFLVDILPDLHDIDLLKTPEFLVRIFGWGTVGSGVEMAPPGGNNNAMPAPGVVRPPRDIPRTGRTAGWGSGRTLGSS